MVIDFEKANCHDSLKELDPEGVTNRKSKCIKRLHYSKVINAVFCSV